MRFTFLLPSDNLTGGARVVAVYARELLARGHEVLVITCAPDRPTWRERLRRRWRVASSDRPVDAAPAGHIALSGVPHRVMDRPGPIRASDLPDADVVVATWWETAVWMAAMPPSKGQKVHLIQGYEIWLGPQTVPRVQAALRLPNVKVAISADLRRTIESAVGPLDITVIPNAVDPAQFDAPSRARHERFTVGFVYAHAAIKGADICIRACELAREQVPELEVLAFGTDRPSPDLPLPAGARFFHRPPQDQLRHHYAACDAWLFGSRLDSFGLPILEAMACRTPVIAVPVGAAPDLLSGGAGLLVPPESPAGMAEAIVRLAREPVATWEAMSVRAHAMAHGYTWQDAVDRFLGCLAQRR